MTPTILMTGATGFLGNPILRELALESKNRIHALLRRPDKTTLPMHVHPCPGDLTSPESLIGACTGVDTVVHAASYVGPDAEQCDLINRRGTEALVDAAVKAGVHRILYLSTAAVYGNGPHRGCHENDLTPAPVSTVSRSRLYAEGSIRQAGGVVLRPHLVYGRGDRWFIPTLVAIAEQIGGWVAHGNALLSTISALDLARAVAGLVAATPGALPAGAALHTNHPRPTAVHTILNSVKATIPRPIPPDNVTRAEALRRLQRHGSSERHLMMMTEDHWYRSNRVWQLAKCAPGRPFELDIDHCTDWYLQALS